MLSVRFSSAIMINLTRVCVYDRMLFSVFISTGRHPYIPVCTLCRNGWLNQDGFNRTSFPYNQFRAGINRGSAFSKCTGLPAVPLDHSGRLSDMAGLRQHLLADSYGENQYDQVEGLTNGNKWRERTASRCIHAVRACHRSSETAHTDMFSVQQKL